MIDDHASKSVEEQITFQLDGKYKKLTIEQQKISGRYNYDSYVYIDCDGTRVYSITQADEENSLEFDITNVQQCLFTLCKGHNSNYKQTTYLTDVLFV